MGEYAETSHTAKIRCIECNSPVVFTIDEEYLCLTCGKTPVKAKVLV